MQQQGPRPSAGSSHLDGPASAPAAPSKFEALDNGTAPSDLGFNGQMADSKPAPAGGAKPNVAQTDDVPKLGNSDALDSMRVETNPSVVDAFGYLMG